MIVLIDNYDSFTFNLYHYLGGLGAQAVVHRNDKIATPRGARGGSGRHRAFARPLHPERGRHLPRSHRAGVRAYPDFRRLPRPSGDRTGFRRARWVRAPVPVHGKLSQIKHQGAGVFFGINGPFGATRYHSLVVDAREPAGRSGGDGGDR